MMHLAPFILLCLLSILGTVGNIFIIAAVCLRKKLRVRGNMFVVNLAVADLIVTGYIMPIGLMTSQYEVSPFGESLCNFNAFLIMTTLGVSTQSLMMIALERYIHICQTRFYDRILQPWTCGILVVVCWIYAIIWTCQGWTGWTNYVYASSIYVCIFVAAESLSYTICLAFFGVILPMIVISVCYYKIFRTVKLSRQNLRTITVSNSDDPVLKDLQRKQKKKLRQEHRLVMTLFMIVVIFICFWLPTAIILPLVGFIRDLPRILFAIAIWTAFANSCVNSLVYGVMNKNFRDGYKALFRYVCCCGRATCRGLNSHVEQSRDEDTVTTSQQHHQPGSPTASMTTVRTSVSRESDRKQAGASEKKPGSTEKYTERKVYGATDSLRNQDGNSDISENRLHPSANLQVHDAPRGNNNIKGNIKGNGIKDNGIKDNGIKDNGIKDNDLKGNIKGNSIKDNGFKDNGTKNNGISDYRHNSKGNLQVHDVSRSERDLRTSSKSHNRRSLDNTGYTDPHQVFYTNDSHQHTADGHWKVGQRSPREQATIGGSTEWQMHQVKDEMGSLEFDFKISTNGGTLQYYDGDLMMISKV